MSRVSHCQQLVIRFALLPLLLCLQQAPAATDATTPLSTHTFFRHLASLLSQPSQQHSLERYDFATIALDELTTAYEAAYRESAAEAHAAKREQRKLARWRNGSREFIDQLHNLHAAISADSRIEISVSPSESIILFFDETPVVVSGPEIAEAKLMEQHIIRRFCRLHECDRYRDKPLSQPLADKPPHRGGWSLQRQSVQYITGDGLTFVFRTIERRKTKQQVCETISQDLRQLVSRIQLARQAGYLIEPSALKIATLGNDKTELITLNRAGDYVKMDLRFVDKLHPLDPRLLHWVAKRIAGEQPYLLIPDADNLIRMIRQ